MNITNIKNIADQHIIYRATYVCLIITLFSGCAAQRPAALKNSVEISGDFDRIWTVCQAQIKNRGFELDRLDFRNGVIETYPLISKQWFEFWHNDVIDGNSLAQSSLHTINRLVKLKIDKLDSNNYQLQCKVEKLKIYHDRDVAGGNIRAQETFTASQSRIFNNKYSNNIKWLPAGNDPVLQQAILTDISNKLDAGVASAKVTKHE